MLSIEVRVNRDLIGHAYVVNKGESKNGIRYHVTYYSPCMDRKISEFDVFHNPEEGAEKLILLVYEGVVRKLHRGKKD